MYNFIVAIILLMVWHIQALVVCTLVVSNLLLLFLHELNKCNTKSRSKLYELDKDDVKQDFFVFCSGKTLLGIVSWFLFFFFYVIFCVRYMKWMPKSLLVLWQCIPLVSWDWQYLLF